MEGDTTPTIQVTVNVTMPMELQMKSFSPTFQRAMTRREVRINHIKNGEMITSNSHSDCKARIAKQIKKKLMKVTWQ
jgi:hypothetical protein